MPRSAQLPHFWPVLVLPTAFAAGAALRPALAAEPVADEGATAKDGKRRHSQQIHVQRDYGATGEVPLERRILAG